MIILDTNVISEMMRKHPDERVIRWLDHQHTSQLWLTAVTIFEIQYGIERLPPGRKQAGLQQCFNVMLRSLYRDRVIEFDLSAAIITAKLSAECFSRGENMSHRDLAIAGIAIQHGATVATRNEKDFPHHQLEVINPWQEE